MKQEVETRYCRTCGSEIARGNLTPAEYSGRIFCQRKCIRKYEKPTDPRSYDHNCIQCGGLISITLPKWEGIRGCDLPKKFCSNACKSEAQRVYAHIEKTCNECGVKFTRKPNEDYRTFMKREYCCRACKYANHWKNNEKKNKGLDGNYTSQNGKMWGSMEVVDAKIVELKERGFALTGKKNENTKQVWRKKPEGYGVQWLTNKETKEKTWHYTNSKKVFANYSGVNELD